MLFASTGRFAVLGACANRRACKGFLYQGKMRPRRAAATRVGGVAHKTNAVLRRLLRRTLEGGLILQWALAKRHIFRASACEMSKVAFLENIYTNGIIGLFVISMLV